MGKKVDFEKLRRRRQRVQSLKRIIALVVILGAVGAVVIVNNLLIDTGFTIRISDMVDSVGGSGFPAPVPGGVIRDVQSMGKHLAVLNDTNLYIYNKKGKAITNLQQMSDNTVMVPGSQRVLTYDVGSKRYSVDTRSKNLLTKETEFSVLCADMNERGDVAVVTSSKQYVAEMNVYNSKFEWVYQWLWSDNLVADIALSPKGDTAVAGCLNTQGGVLKTVLYLLSFSSDKAMGILEYPDEMILDIAYLGQDTIGFLTDREYRVLSGGGTTLSSYTLGEGQLTAVEHRDKNCLILTSNKEARTQHLVLLDTACRVTASLHPDKKIKDIALGDGRVYLLSDEGIATLNGQLEEKSFLSQRGITEIHLVGNKLYYITQEEIAVLE